MSFIPFIWGSFYSLDVIEALEQVSLDVSLTNFETLGKLVN